jgi:F0F1-type ATP synthase delta subunit
VIDTLSRRHLAEVLAEKTLGLPTDKLAHEIAAYLLEHRHTADLESLMRDIILWRQKHGVIEAVAVSAHELPEAVLDDIKGILREHFPKAKKIFIDTRIDPDLVGGVRIDMADEQLDMTVKAKLNTFKRLTSEGVM